MTVTQLEAYKIIPYTENEALASMKDAKLTKNQYEIIHIQAKAKNTNIYPLYASMAELKKTCYHPDSVFKITEDSVSVSTQALMDHTASRSLQLPDILPSDIRRSNTSVSVLFFYMRKYAFWKPFSI